MELAQKYLHETVNEYLNFTVAGKVVPIPYVLNRSRWNFWRTSGKGLPENIKSELERDAISKKFDLSIMTEFEIYDFMRKRRIGIECSGFVFHVLNAYLKALKEVRLEDVLLRYRGILGLIERRLLKFQRHHRINAKTLTSELNTKLVERVNQIKVGDLIRMSVKRSADHVLIVTDVMLDSFGHVNKIMYAHSSSKTTKKRGPHIGEIIVTDDRLGVGDQNWLEESVNGLSYRQYFHPEKGDSVRRLTMLWDN